jgi:type II secretory pathway pseudopilin PulG
MMKRLMIALAVAGAIATAAGPVLVLISDDASAQSRTGGGVKAWCYKNGKRTSC